MTQLAYSLSIGIGVEGQIYAQFPSEITSKAVETVAGIAPARVVSRGTADNQVVLGGTTPFGITVRSLDIEGAVNTNNAHYDQYKTAPIMLEGYIVCACPTGCSPGDPVNYVEATGVLDSGAASGTGETALDDCSWESSAAAGALAVLRVKNLTSFTAGT